MAVFTSSFRSQLALRPCPPPTKAQLDELEATFQRHWLSKGVLVIRN